MSIRNQIVCDDEAMTQEDCQKALEACKGPRERLLISLHIETLQRPSTINSLTWGDVLEHIQGGETTFLIKIGAKRTKRNISHWAPVGPLSSYHISEVYKKLRVGGVKPKGSDPLISNQSCQKLLKPITANAFLMKVTRILERAGIRGRKQGEAMRARYIKHPQGFRKFGRIAMQDAGAPDEAIEHLMGHMTSTYSKWLDRKEELLNIYRRSHPSLDERTAVQQVLDFANSLGLSLDPKALHEVKRRDLQVHAGPGPRCEGAAGA